MNDFDLHRVFGELDSKLEHLSSRLESYRTYDRPEEDQKRKLTSKCTWVCGKEADPETKSRCMRQCQSPIVPIESIENMYKEFPVDVQRLREDTNLRQVFERHQRSPQSIPSTDEECIVISDIYAMPISVHTLPDEAWGKSLAILMRSKHEKHLHALLANWEGRQADFPESSRKELVRKLSRHDKHGVLRDAIKKGKKRG